MEGLVRTDPGFGPGPFLLYNECRRWGDGGEERRNAPTFRRHDAAG